MLIKDIEKMINRNIAADNVELDMGKIDKCSEYSFCAWGVKGGYVISFSINDKHVDMISSKREDMRIFKTLPGIQKTLSEIGITSFDVRGMSK